MKKKLIMALAVTTLSLTAGLGTHFGMSSNSGQNSSENTQAVRNLRNVAGNVSYEFDVLNFRATNQAAVKLGVQVLDSNGKVIKDEGNFQLANRGSFISKNTTYNFDSYAFNTQQVIKLDNLSSAGAKIRVYDVDNFNAKTSPTQYSDIDINVSVKNATAYDNVNKAYYAGIVTAGHPRKHEWFSYNANTSDMAQTVNVFQVEYMESIFNGVLSTGANPKPVKNHAQRPNLDDWSSKNFNSTSMSSRDFRTNILTYQTPLSFTMLRTEGVTFYQGAIDIKVGKLIFLDTQSIKFHGSFYLDHVNDSWTKADQKASSNESNTVSQVVDMTTLAGAAKTVHFFNSRNYIVGGDGTGQMDLQDSNMFSSPTVFNDNAR